MSLIQRPCFNFLFIPVILHKHIDLPSNCFPHFHVPTYCYLHAGTIVLLLNRVEEPARTRPNVFPTPFHVLHYPLLFPHPALPTHVRLPYTSSDTNTDHYATPSFPKVPHDTRGWVRFDYTSFAPVYWVALGLIGIDWNGMGWDGMGWDVIKQNIMRWN